MGKGASPHSLCANISASYAGYNYFIPVSFLLSRPRSAENCIVQCLAFSLFYSIDLRVIYFLKKSIFEFSSASFLKGHCRAKFAVFRSNWIKI